MLKYRCFSKRPPGGAPPLRRTAALPMASKLQGTRKLRDLVGSFIRKVRDIFAPGTIQYFVEGIAFTGMKT